MLNDLCSVLCLEWVNHYTLFLHLSSVHLVREERGEIVEEERDESKVNICNCTPIQEQYEEQQSKVIKSLLILLTHDECLW